MGSGEKKKQKLMKKKDSGNKAGKGKQGDEQNRLMITDKRFASVQSDPRFMRAPKKRSKVSIDSRFSQIFTDPSFASSNAPTDKRGKPVNKKKATTSLERYYHLKQEDEDEKKKSPIETDEDDDLGEPDAAQSETESEKLNESLDEDVSGDEQSLDESSSTSAEDSDEQYVDEEEEDDTFLEPENVPDIDSETRRLAVVNLDWGQVRAVDLYVLLSSFLPKQGQILSVNVYPSEFGLKRMDEEKVRGPSLFVEEDSDDEEGDEIDSRKLRAYELSKLKYYYAVVECDSIATADYLYKTCDGLEFERSANKLDLRFIPDSMEFTHLPRDVATEAPADYEGLDFQTRALQHSNVELTWDEDEPQRAKTLKRKFTDEQLDQLELKEILASDESETDDDNDGKVNKYRALIQSGNDSDNEHEEDKDLDMELTFNSRLEDISKRILEKKDKKSETLWEAHLRKRREKRKASKNRSKYSSEEDSSDTDQEHTEEADDFFDGEPSDVDGEARPVRKSKGTKTNKVTAKEEAEASRAELELLAVDDEGCETKLKGYNLKRKKGKGKKQRGVQEVGEIPTAVSDDPRFSEIFKNPLFALDPSDPQFKRSATYFRQIAKKQKQGDQELSEIPDEVSRPKDENKESGERMAKNELSTLIKSIKMKSKQVSSQPQGKMRRKS